MALVSRRNFIAIVGTLSAAIPFSSAFAPTASVSQKSYFLRSSPRRVLHSSSTAKRVLHSTTTSLAMTIIPGRPTWQQTMLRIKDPQASLKFYTELLGFTLIDTFDFPQVRYYVIT